MQRSIAVIEVLVPSNVSGVIAALFVCFTSSALVPSPALADSPQPSLSERIDAAINQRIEAAGVESAPLVEHAAFARRVTLDLAGRIPTRDELREFLAADEATARQTLVTRLLGSPDFAFHQRNELDILLLAKLRWDDRWRQYLLEAARENRPWDQLFRELMLPEQHRPDDSGAAAFLRHRAHDLDALTNDASALLFGINIACAKCHDHPLVLEWEQADYFGMASFFKRTYPTRRGFVAERFEGNLRFTTVLGEEKDASFMFLTGVKVDEPRFERDDEEWKRLREQIQKAEQDEKAEAPPRPEFSPRAELVELALTEDHRYLARNIANRIWARLMGRGLVHPLDQMHAENPPSHPELLDLLTEELVQHDYDLKHLIRSIVLSDAYARASHLADGAEPPPTELFAVRSPVAMTPFQLSLSLLVATRNPETWPGAEKPAEWPEQRQQWENRAEGLARQFEIPVGLFQVPVEEALLLSNGAQTDGELLSDDGEHLVGYLKGIEATDERIDQAFLAVLSRLPDGDERARVAAYLSEREDRPVAAVGQLVWALLTSAEFRFNH